MTHRPALTAALLWLLLAPTALTADEPVVPPQPIKLTAFAHVTVKQTPLASKAAEAAACLPFLRHQISLVGPKVIVLLGATALKHLLPARKSDAMKDIVGEPFTDGGFPGVTFLVFYHPAFLLRDPRRLPDAREHIATLRGLLR